MAVPTPSVKPRDDQNFWNFVFLVLSLAVLAAEVWVLMYLGKLPTSIGLFDLTLIILATFRLTRLFVYDTIMQFVRDWFLDKEEREGSRGEWVVVRHKPAGGAKRTMADLMGCPWCFGMQAAILVVFLYYLTPLAWIVILMLAVAGVATFIQLLANLIGWSAEHKKRLCNQTEE